MISISLMKTRNMFIKYNLLSLSLYHYPIFLYFQLFGFVSLSMVLISTTTFILQTNPELENNKEYPIVYTILTTTDTIVIVSFTIEYLIRLLCCPRKIKFFFK